MRELVRDQIQQMAGRLSENPNDIDANDLSQLRWQVGNLISLMENQLYCVTRLAAADIEVLQEPHRKAYIQDLVSEAEMGELFKVLALGRGMQPPLRGFAHGDRLHTL